MTPTQNARRLRRNATDAENLLWSHLRASQLSGFKFRRQSPIGQYFVDFECYEAKLIIELDGGQHQEQASYDRRRTEYLQARGYRVLRFWNNDVLTHTDAVLQSILLALEPRAEPISPSPRPGQKNPLSLGRGLG